MERQSQGDSLVGLAKESGMKANSPRTTWGRLNEHVPLAGLALALTSPAAGRPTTTW